MGTKVDVVGTNDINISSKKKILNITFIVVSVILCLFILQTLIMTLTYDKVYDGVYLNGDRVSHLSKDELDIFLENKYNKPLKSSVITITFNDMKWTIDPDDINLSIDKDNIIDKLYSPGHDGNIFKRLSKIVDLRMNNLHVDLFENKSSLIIYDKDKVNDFANKIAKECYTEVVEHNVTVNNSKVIITSGQNGYELPVDKVADKIIKTLNNTDSFSTNLEDIAIVTKPKSLKADEIAEELYKPAVNATYKVVNNKEIIIAEDKKGQRVDTIQLSKVVNILEDNPNQVFSVDLLEIEPEIKADGIKQPTFNDILGHKTTYYTASDKNRNYNIYLATKTINGKYLLPGEVFSFNDFIGDTTASKGYKPAASYLNGMVVDSYGGGVCQVSTTLYNAVIDAGLEIVERSNHSLTVGYVPLGLDAAIAYPYKDLKFKNNTSEPILIEGTTTNTSVTFRIKGVNNNKNRTYKFELEIIKKTDYTTKYVDDPSLPKGTTKVRQNGKPGYLVKTYRHTYIDGKKVKTESFTTSRYNPQHKIIARGTK